MQVMSKGWTCGKMADWQLLGIGNEGVTCRSMQKSFSWKLLRMLVLLLQPP